MTTAEFIVCEILGCGQMDIESCFGNMDDEIFSNAVRTCKDEFGTLDAGAIWNECIYEASVQAFEDDWELVEPRFNYMASDVAFTGNPDEIEDFERKAAEFADLTGFDLQY